MPYSTMAMLSDPHFGHLIPSIMSFLLRRLLFVGSAFEILESLAAACVDNHSVSREEPKYPFVVFGNPESSSPRTSFGPLKQLREIYRLSVTYIPTRT